MSQLSLMISSLLSMLSSASASGGSNGGCAGGTPANPGSPGASGSGPGADTPSGSPGTTPGSPGSSSGSAGAVQDSRLTSAQQQFAARLAQDTGLDPKVIAAWELAEESGGAAQSRQSQNNNNWLNIGYFDSGKGKIASDQAFSNPAAAADQTANFLKGSWGGASSGIRNILSTVGQSSTAQMAAIAGSGWASSHYNATGSNPGGNIASLYTA